jgi:hypothetical protein
MVCHGPTQRYDRHMHPVAVLMRKGATPGQAATVVYGLSVLILAMVGLLLVDRQSGEAALVVIAVSAPRALLGLVACWGKPGDGPVIPELPDWRAVHFNR